MLFEKAKCTTSQVAEIVSLFPFGGMLEYMNVSGVPNTTYKIIAEHRTFMLRIYGKGQTSCAHITLEHCVLKYLALKKASTPRLLEGTDGRTLQLWRGYHVCAFAFIGGTLGSDLAITCEMAKSVGQSVAILRSALDHFPCHLIPSDESLFARGELAIANMRKYVIQKSLTFDVRTVACCWESAANLLQSRVAHKQGLIHADTWPPNVIFDDHRVVGIIDFDDCCYGPRIIDIAIPLQEFAFFQPFAMRRELVQSLCSGLFGASLKLTSSELSLLIPSMKLMCAIWCAYNLVQSTKISDAEVYYHRLAALDGAPFRDLIEVLGQYVTEK